MKAIYIGDNKLKEVPEMEKPVFNERTYPTEADGFVYMNDMDRYRKQLAACKTYDIDGEHSFIEGEEYEEGVHYKLEKLHVDADGNEAVIYTVGWKRVALPLPKQESQDEMWLAVVVESHCAPHTPDGINSVIDKFKQQFHITRKNK